MNKNTPAIVFLYLYPYSALVCLDRLCVSRNIRILCIYEHTSTCGGHLGVFVNSALGLILLRDCDWSIFRVTHGIVLVDSKYCSSVLADPRGHAEFGNFMKFP